MTIKILEIQQHGTKFRKSFYMWLLVNL